MEEYFVGKTGYDVFNDCYVNLVAEIATVGETDGGHYWVACKLDGTGYMVVDAGELDYGEEES